MRWWPFQKHQSLTCSGGLRTHTPLSSWYPMVVPVSLFTLMHLCLTDGGIDCLLVCSPDGLVLGRKDIWWHCSLLGVSNLVSKGDGDCSLSIIKIIWCNKPHSPTLNFLELLVRFFASKMPNLSKQFYEYLLSFSHPGSFTLFGIRKWNKAHPHPIVIAVVFILNLFNLLSKPRDLIGWTHSSCSKRPLSRLVLVSL